MKKLASKKEVRKQVYDLLQGIIGRELTVSEHNEIRDAVNTYVSAQLGYKEYRETPKTHHLICRECSAKKTVVGQKAISNAYRGKRRGFVAQ